MLWRRRYYHRFTLAELEIRREKRALIVQRALRLFAIVLALCLTMLLSLVCFKPWKDLRSLEHERSFLQAHLEKSREQMEQAKNEFIWISQDPHYFEMIARDKGNLALPGEHILRIAEPKRLKYSVFQRKKETMHAVPPPLPP